MTADQHHSEHAGRREPKSAITAEEFAAVEIEGPIHGSKNVDCWSLGSLYQSAASEAEAIGNEPAAWIFTLLFEIANIYFKPEDRAEPFGPLSVHEE